LDSDLQEQAPSDRKPSTTKRQSALASRKKKGKGSKGKKSAMEQIKEEQDEFD
jgi:hypothetical protein